MHQAQVAICCRTAGESGPRLRAAADSLTWRGGKAFCLLKGVMEGRERASDRVAEGGNGVSELVKLRSGVHMRAVGLAASTGRAHMSWHACSSDATTTAAWHNLNATGI